MYKDLLESWILILLDIYVRVELLGHNGNSVFNFVRNCTCPVLRPTRHLGLSEVLARYSGVGSIGRGF